jgi:glycosyltransferase involved in cell wall biosynthesis
MITKNSFEKVGNFFGRVLESSLQVPYNVIILVDDSDTDRTREFVKRFADEHGKEVIVERSRLYGWHKPTRATARQTTIDIFLQNTSDEWLFFLDDDCVLNHGWWRWVEENKVLEDGRVGEVWGINWDATPERERYLKKFGIDLGQYLIQKFEERGGTHDTLYRRAALEGVVIPPELHVYEDAWLHFWVKCRGWKHAVNPIGVTHYNPLSLFTDLRREMEKLKLAIAIANRYGITEYKEPRDRSWLGRGMLAYLYMLRHIAGFFPMLVTTTKLYGWRIGFSEAVKRQYLKLWFRWQVMKHVKHPLPDTCQVMQSLYDVAELGRNA